MILTDKQKKNFLKKFQQGNLNECWEWKGNKFNFGYGRFKLNGKYQRAHRLSYELFKGKIPEGLCVCHSCDNTSCVNPNHLWLGTQSENIKDCLKKNRTSRGEKNANFSKHIRPKLTEKEVKEIRNSNLSSKELSKEYKVSASTIRKAKSGINWKIINNNRVGEQPVAG